MGEDPGKGQRIIDSEAAPYGSLAIAEWVPCETDPWLEVVKRLVLGPESVNRRLGWARDSCQHGKRVMGFDWKRHRLVTHAEVQRKVRARMPIVLNVGSEQCLMDIDRFGCRWIV